MKMPAIFLSYGDFKITNKLFYYDFRIGEEKKSVLPIFDDPTLTSEFIKNIKDGLNIDLRPQVCENKIETIKSIQMIMLCGTDIEYIVLNPNLKDDNLRLINDFIEDLNIQE